MLEAADDDQGFELSLQRGNQRVTAFRDVVHLQEHLLLLGREVQRRSDHVHETLEAQLRDQLDGAIFSGGRQLREAREQPSQVVAAADDIMMQLVSGHVFERLDLGQKFYPDIKNGLAGNVICAIVFAFLCWLLVGNARKKLDA